MRFVPLAMIGCLALSLCVFVPNSNGQENEPRPDIERLEASLAEMDAYQASLQRKLEQAIKTDQQEAVDQLKADLLSTAKQASARRSQLENIREHAKFAQAIATEKRVQEMDRRIAEKSPVILHAGVELIDITDAPRGENVDHRVSPRVKRF